MTTTDDWSNLSKKEIINRAKELDERRQAQIQRQIDSINRLIDAQGTTSRVKRYEDELMTLNEQLALKDMRVLALERAVSKIAQKVRDKLRVTQNGKEYTFFDSLYQVLVLEAGWDAYDDVHGRTSEGDNKDRDEDPIGA